MGTVIAGSGIAVPPLTVHNKDLARIMDTSDDWIQSRTGVVQRHFVDPGVGASDLAIQACQAALDDAGVAAADVDLVVTATMTPDEFVPGIAPTIQHQLGIGTVAAYDLRQQCSGFLYALDMADAALTTGRARTALVVGAEAHAGYLPFGASWDILRGVHDRDPAPDDLARANDARAWAVLFGDGAGAFVLRSDDSATGVLASSLHTNGALNDLIRVQAAGFKQQPWLDHAQLEAQLHLPTFSGMELFRQASRLMPAAVRVVAARAGVEVDDIDVVVAHQANERIIQAVRKEMNLGERVIPCNIADYGNTTAATLPILYRDLIESDRIAPGSLVCFTAFGAGAHWGALLYQN